MLLGRMILRLFKKFREENEPQRNLFINFNLLDILHALHVLHGRI